MRSYVPNTADERRSMLEAIGLTNMQDLFADITGGARLARPLDLPSGKSEMEVRRAIHALPVDAGALPLFRGAGAYRHEIPAVVGALSGRAEFYTAYTPYQAEMSQGMLQSIFEYQTLMTQLTGMDVSNASVYDGATACAEVMISLRGAIRGSAAKKSTILYSAGLHPEYIQTIKTYARFAQFTLIEIPLDAEGKTELQVLRQNAANAAGALIPSPNFFGIVEDFAPAAQALHENGALLAAVANPISLGLLKRPGDAGADFCVGEGQPLGMPLSAGGPYLGFMTAKQQYTRNLPGRIVGETADADGNRTFVLTLQAREQHIRREKAASNICSNQSLCAISAAFYLAAMGPQGMREVAALCLQKAHYLYDGIKSIKGFTPRYAKSPFFHEFVMEYAGDAQALNVKLRAAGFIGGLPLGRYFPGDSGVLFCATETNTREEIDAFLNALEVAAK